MFSALAENHGNLNAKISTFIALAPVASFKMQHTRTKHDQLVGLHNLLTLTKKTLHRFGIYEFGPSLHFVKAAKTLIYPFMSKKDQNESDNGKSISVKQVLHFGQLELSGKFMKFDYGKKKNLKIYKSSVPPQIYMKNIKVPTSMFVGTDDMIGSPKDSVIIKNQLSKGVLDHYELLDGFDHGQFSLDTTMKYYKNVIKILKKHNKTYK